MKCHYCGEPLEPNSRETWQAVWGWQRAGGKRASGAQAGSDIYMRTGFDRFAHAHCVVRERSGVSARQGAMPV